MTESAEKSFDPQRAGRVWVCPLIASIAAVLMLIRAGSTIPVFSDTADEAFHIGSAVALVETGRAVHGLETPPVARWVQGGPLALAGAELPTGFSPQDRTIQDNVAAFELGDAILARGSLPYWRVLTVARVATLLFAAVAIFYVYLLGNWIGGPVVAMLATLFCSTDPTLLAHSALATADAAATAGFLAATYHGLRWAFEPTYGRALASGVALGLAIGAKFTSILLIPVLVVLALWSISGRDVRTVRRLVTHVLILAAVSFLTLWACYLFDVGKLSDYPPIGDGRLDWFPRSIVNVTIPMPSLFIGLGWLVHHNAHGHIAYLAGNYKTGGWWYYFPLALVFKSTLAFVLGMLLALGLSLFRVRHVRASLALLAIVLTVMLFSMSSNIQIGVRHLLPITPLLYVLITLQLTRGRRWMVVLVILIAMSFAETLWRHPDYLSFFNIASRRGCGERPLLLDSNLDWGQDLARLSRWLRENHPDTPYETRVFARNTLRHVPGIRLKVNEVLHVSDGLLIVSKNVKYKLYPVADPTAGEGSQEPLELPAFIYNAPPHACIGDSLEVYRLPPGRGVR